MSLATERCPIKPILFPCLCALNPKPLQAELELFPRYPLLGGWSIRFTLGYSVPLGDLVSIRPDGTRVLNATFGTPFHDTVVRDLTVKVCVVNECWVMVSDLQVV